MLQMYVSNVSAALNICCKYFIWMLQMFVMIFKCFEKLFSSFHKDVSSVLSAFFCKLQVLYLDVSKVD